MLLLQSTKLAETTADAASTVTQQMSQQGPLFVLLWLLVLVACGIAFFMYLKADKAVAGREKAVAEAVAEAREQFAAEQALNAGHQQGMAQQMRDQYERQIQALREDRNQAQQLLAEVNRDLRQQEGKSIEVLASVGNKIGEFTRLMADISYRIQCLDATQQGRFAPPPPMPTHSSS